MSHTDGEKSNLAEEKLPYWNYNIPKDRWTEECPAFLVGGDAADAAQLATRDEDYQLMSWEDVQDIISAHQTLSYLRIKELINIQETIGLKCLKERLRISVDTVHILQRSRRVMVLS